MKLRAASEADVPALAHVAERSYRSAFAGILEEEVLTRRDAAFFAMRFAETWDRLVVAEDDGNPIGFLLVTDNHIDMLFVDPPGNRHGRRFAASSIMRNKMARARWNAFATTMRRAASTNATAGGSSANMIVISRARAEASFST